MSLLDGRLSQVLALIPGGSILLDIGTDHCKLPAEGLLSGKLAGAYAADLRQGPLDAAAKQLKELGLQDRIPLFLSDGLKQIPLEVLHQVTAVSVAGMGGELISAIMKSAPAEPPLWVLQPMSAVYELAEDLARGGYQTVAAALAQDGDKFYRILAVKKTGESREPDYFEQLEQDPLLGAYLEKEENRIRAALRGLHSARHPDARRIQREEQLLAAVERVKNGKSKRNL